MGIDTFLDQIQTICNQCLHIHNTIDEVHSRKMKISLQNGYLLVKKLTFVKTVDDLTIK